MKTLVVTLFVLWPWWPSPGPRKPQPQPAFVCWNGQTVPSPKFCPAQPLPTPPPMPRW